MITLHQPGILCALGNDIATVRANLFAAHSPGLQQTDAWSPGRRLTVGMVTAHLPPLDDLPLPHRSRNNALLAAAFAQIETRYRALAADIPAARIAIVLGTSTSGIAEGEAAIAAGEQHGALPDGFHYGQQELGSPAQWLAQHLGVAGPAYCVSTACTSGAKALAAGARLLQSGMADLVLAGGVDSLARFTIAGFSALEAISSARCLPSSANRCGINIGEGAALFIMTRDGGPVRLAGWGESSDGHHISAPDPAGNGARLAITAALQRAGRSEVGYINLHGTATQQNDAMEHKVVADLLPGVPASSTKGLTGHTLGAAGAIEAAFCWLALTDEQQRLPPHTWDGVADPELPALPLVASGARSAAPLQAALSTSFAFGGNNIALLLERA
ncbi:3-oxoacyl-[acyl-carrier-protein] synthase-1 [Andreprevotia lacus DSM 23236]|jgi:3-oxoacyl-[acyl-carrier-protein] synthase-1|uniref:3-oxoacyl-[acyl-carrier-protein] synthase-1 n=1 Tax=Andreprevotia lacus DSM 23236 TaxID=1121001 RepID=A0A1W1X3N0_9NEIS|nr:beta-ketoacyl-ACP synthase [Andreprevotia lacus]SMC18564.1 3-oxoacyl-[acyl-carrier-protein] synthase-1 [Andreprevotia lacus DSM 23236]